jgi:hypothetical protein
MNMTRTPAGHLALCHQGAGDRGRPVPGDLAVLVNLVRALRVEVEADNPELVS